MYLNGASMRDTPFGVRMDAAMCWAITQIAICATLAAHGPLPNIASKEERIFVSMAPVIDTMKRNLACADDRGRQTTAEVMFG
jgi:hypothetical protein